MNADNPVYTFIAESRDLLRAMEDALLQVERTPDDATLINEIFRAAHTIKGSAGLFGMERIVAFTHLLESLLDRVRDGELALDGARVALLLASGDHLLQLVEHCDGGDLPAAVLAHGTSLAQRLQQDLPDLQGISAGTAVIVAAPAPSGAGHTAGHWHLSLRFGPDLFRNGMDPLSLFSYLDTLGRVLHVETVLDHLPRLAELEPETCHLGFEVAFLADCGRDAIAGAFEFVREDSRLHFLPPDSPLSDFDALLEELSGAGEADAGERLVRCGSLSVEELDMIRQRRAMVVTAPPAHSMAQAGNATVAARASRGGATLRVDADKMDHHINLMGELVVASAGAKLAAQRADATAMREAAETLDQLVQAVRDSALKLRMVPIGATFDRFQRLVRDTSQELGKDIRLVITGGDTELDKMVVERIADPLTHLVRNAIDHGMETAATRLARGKPAQGQLLLNARHEAGQIVIEVTDDGAGLDRDKILRKALERGLVAADAELSPREIDRLIFEPGFSTADAVSKLSGRGVGMDVVRANIEALRGSVSLESLPGQGSTVRIRLPLTLAIIDGFMVGVGDCTYVIPLEMVEECIALTPSCMGKQAGCLDLRGEVLPFRRLREQFGIGGQAGRRESVVVVRYGERKAGLVVDRLMGEFQTVIKPLGRMFSGLSGVTGFTILGGGDVALILDIHGLMRQLEKSTHE
ncbi:chemotaxis protein CheA [Duganella sp. FT92W]|uniref:Chemotaxis protein CheA n=1 Tax=Pseudoduganella rivuli TaxID=2666085 RepID=A0A7X2LT03_9BURK|nr:chemotaxis protein CheA [Pseudoduganella rivuli]MRV72796.1 chemotaxis protein CheA [Pseudoduganella rivuli]